MLIVQIAALYGLNNILASDIRPKVSRARVIAFQEENIKDFSVSYDQSFYAFETPQALEIFRLRDNKPEMRIEREPNETVNFMKWLPDENRLIYATSSTSSRYSRSTVEVHVVNVDKRENILVNTLKRLPEGSIVRDVTFSTLTNLIYINTEDGHGRDKIYQIDILKRLKNVATRFRYINKIAQASRQDLLYLEDQRLNRIYAVSEFKAERVSPDAGQYILLGLDNQDQAYLGEVNDNKVVAIYRGDVDHEFQRLFVPPAPLERDNIHIGARGQIFYVEYPQRSDVTMVNPDGTQKIYHVGYGQRKITDDAILVLSTVQKKLSIFSL